MKTRIALAFGMVSTLSASSAFAEDVVGSTGVEKKMRLGAQVDVLPVGTFGVKATGVDESFDLSTAYGVGLTFDYDVTPNISVGLAPRYIMNVIPKDVDEDEDSIEELDLRARVTVHFPVIDKLQVYGFAAPGYSIIMADDEDENVNDPAGFVVAFGAGATYDVSPNLFLSAEAGYQLGFQAMSIENTPVGTIDADVQTDFLHFGLGAGTRF